MNGALYDPIGGLATVALALLPVALVILLSRTRRLGLEREIAFAVARGIVQLMLVALVIVAVFESESLLLAVLVLVGMMGVAALISARRAEGIGHPHRITFPAIAAGSSAALLILIALGVIPLILEFIIPIGSMAVGAAMIACSLALNRFTAGLAANRLRIETALSLGASVDEALAPVTRESVRASLIPSIDRLKALGLVVLPGSMAGMIIGGADPVWAAEYQLVIMFMIFSAEFFTSVTATSLALAEYPLPEDGD
ncbi:iron export ABC transporter permease subunit FetB [Methanoculleus sp. Wushi-C6]|uniref:Iron export ABC transporter permease subunit FetB n=1 Tax=Methanoculleus caldifontis TaxID=2651577 RepID=A0ABU3WXH2_9EURY|nr:iron export ABC transporter permease subunit FetB [Methanoculleus sp. Wushi-C6]MDV2480483.1 iron export ABC transporter permease subunit FetB [Methanoculleus sp. Wushi-C6]